MTKWPYEMSKLTEKHKTTAATPFASFPNVLTSETNQIFTPSSNGFYSIDIVIETQKLVYKDYKYSAFEWYKRNGFAKYKFQ